jgi:hypothetical protein
MPEMHKVASAIIDMDTGTYRLLHVEVSASPTHLGRYVWKVLERDGSLIEASTSTYATHEDALREAKAAVRQITMRMLDKAPGRTITYRTPAPAEVPTEAPAQAA